MTDWLSEVDCILTTCTQSFFSNPVHFPLFAAGLAAVVLAVAMVAAAKTLRSKVRWAYLFAFGIIFLVSYFAFSMVCHSGLGFCSGDALLYSLPLAMLASFALAYVVFPRAYLAWLRTSKSQSLARMLPEEVPVYVSDDGRPYAFSYGGVLSRWIVVSQGMVEIMGPQELRAVLLHEYAHLRSNISFYKSAGWLCRMVPVLRGFFDEEMLEDGEEDEADAYAATVQRTRRHVSSAKRKLRNYFRALH